MTDDDSILQKPDLEYKIILLGDTSVGKTCLFKRLTLDIYKESEVCQSTYSLVRVSTKMPLQRE